MPTPREQAYANRFLTETPPQFKAPWSAGAAASLAEGWQWTGASSIARSAELFEAGAGGYAPDVQSETVSPEDLPTAFDEAARRGTMSHVSNERARQMAKEAGVTVDFGEADYSTAAAHIMIDRAVKRKRRQEVIASSEISFPSQLALGFAAGLADPLNLIFAVTPVAPASLLSKIESAAGPVSRAVARAQVGAVEGLTGSAIVEPISAFAATQEGQDYGTAQFLQNLTFGAGAGATFRSGFGAIADVWRSRTSANPPDAADVLARTYVETNQDMLRRAVDDLIEGDRVSASQVLDRAAAENPKLAERVKVSAGLRKDGPAIDLTVNRQAYWIERLKNRSARRKKTNVERDVDDYTTRLFDEAGVKPRTNHMNAARKIVEYEREIVGAERINADLQSEQTFLDELTAQGLDESKLSPDERFEIRQDRARINEQLTRDNNDIDVLASCILGRK